MTETHGHRSAFTRREFGQTVLGAGLCWLGSGLHAAEPKAAGRLSVSSWSFHNYFPNTRYGPPKFDVQEWKLEEVFRRVKDRLGITAFEISSAHLASHEPAYLEQIRGCAKENGCRLIHFCDNLRGVNLATPDAAKREADLKTFEKLIDVAQQLQIPTMRVNTGGPSGKDWDFNVTIECFRRLARYGKERNVEIIIENHFGLSADPKNVVRIIEAVGENISACPDFGLLPKSEDRWPMLELMFKHARRVCSAKFHGLDEQSQHKDFDLKRCYQILKSARFPGWVSLEYEGPFEPLPHLERMQRLARDWLEQPA